MTRPSGVYGGEVTSAPPATPPVRGTVVAERLVLVGVSPGGEAADGRPMAHQPVAHVAHLASYSPRLALSWVAEPANQPHRSVDGTMVYVDVSGFTALTERLAAKGRAGAEEMNGIISSIFGELGDIAGAFGADLLKWGGDAAVLLFDGPGSAARAARTAWLMAEAMRRVGRLRTSVGRVELRVSVGVHSGTFELYLMGSTFRELVLAGPAATRLVEMEQAASAGQVVLSDATASLLDPGALAEPCGPGVLLGTPPQAEQTPVLLDLAATSDHAAALLPQRLRRYLLDGEEQVEHRPVAIGFVHLTGLDSFIERFGAAAAVDEVQPLVALAQEITEQHGVTFHSTNICADGFEILLLAGVPTLEGNDADRLLRCLIEIVGSAGDLASSGASSSPPGPRLSVRAAMNVGKLFVFSALEVGHRRIYSITGDPLNLAARVVARAVPGEVLCTEAARQALRSPFALQAKAPFSAKGKSKPIVTYAVDLQTESLGPVAHAPASLVGRQEELDALLAGAAQVGNGRSGQVIEVVGPAGIGKSRLIDEAVRSWRLRTWRIPCDAFTGGRPYRPFGVVARHLLGLGEDIPAEEVAVNLLATLDLSAPALLPWAPLLAEVFQVSLPSTRQVDDLEPRFRRRRLEAVFVELLEILVGTPTAFVFEDTHALDQASSSLLLRLAEQAERHPWLVVATSRPDNRQPLDTCPSSVIELGALDDSSAEDLLADLAQALGANERQMLAKRAGGNPLFLLELARAAETTGSSEALPEALEPLLASRVDRLAPADRAALRAAAVLGLRFDDELLADILDHPVLEDKALWERLAEFVREVDGERVFAHALIREAAYEGLAFRRRRELHSRAAVAIEQRAKGADSPVELLSVHWFAAERWDRAWECSREAGERATALYANADAARHFRRALDAARQLRTLPRREIATVAERLGDVCELSGNYDGARAAYKEASRRLGHCVDRGRLLRKAGVLQEHRGRYAIALRCYTSALHYLSDNDAPTLVERCELQLAGAGVRHRQWRLRESAAQAASAGEDASLAGYRRGLAHSLYLRHINSVYLNEPDDALGRDALSIFTELGDLVGQGNALNNLGISALYRGAWGDALEHYRASRDVRERSGDLVGAATEENNIGEILSDQGYYADAERCFSAARSTWRAARYRIGEALATSNLGRLSVRTGRTMDGVALLEEAREAFEAIHASSFVADTDLRLLESALLTGELRGTAARAEELARSFSGRRGYQRRTATAVHLLGLALAGQGDVVQARVLLDESVSGLRSLSEGYELAQVLLARARVRRSTGESAAAAADEEEARAIFARLGVVAHHPGPPGLASVPS